MKTLNVRLAAILLVGGMVFCGGVFGLRYYQIRRNAVFFLTNAREAEAQEDYEDAVQNYGWYTNLRPDDTNALEELGMLQAKLGQIARDNLLQTNLKPMSPRESQNQVAAMRKWESLALSTLEKVLRAAPQRADARRKVVDLAMNFLQYGNVRGHLNDAKHGLLTRSPDDGELLDLLGQCHWAVREYAEAEASYAKAIESAPHLLQTYARRAMVLKNNLQRGKEADECMRELLRNNADSARAHSLYGTYVISLQTARTPESVRTHPILLDAMVPAVLDDAVRGAIKGLELPEGNRDVERLTQKKQLLADAIRRALSIHGVAVDDPDALLLAAQRRISLGSKEAAALADAKNRSLRDLQSELASADRQILLLAERHGVLVEGMKRAMATAENVGALILAARMGVVTEAKTHALTAHELASKDKKALAAAKDRNVLHDALKRALTAESDPAVLRQTAKRSTLEEAVKGAIAALPSEGDARQKLTGRQGILVDALRRALDDRELASGSGEGPSSIPKDQVLIGVAERADTAAELELETNDSEALLLAAQCASWQGDNAKARKLVVEQGIKQYPRDYRWYTLMFEIESRSQGGKEPIEWLREGLEKSAGHPVLLLRIADSLIDAGQLDEAQESLGQLRGTRYDSLVAYFEARIEFAKKNWREAIRRFEACRGDLAAQIGSRRWPGASRRLVKADLALAESYRQLGNPDRAQAAYQRVLATSSASSRAQAMARRGITAILVLKGDIDGAMEQFRQLAVRNQDNAGGWILLAKSLIESNLRLAPAQQNWGSVEQALSQVGEDDPEAIQVPIWRYQALLIQARQQQAAFQGTDLFSPVAMALLDEAGQMLLDANKKHPKMLEYWTGLIAVMQERAVMREEAVAQARAATTGQPTAQTRAAWEETEQKAKADWDGTERILTAAERQLGDQVALRIARAQYLVKRHKNAGLEQLGRLADNAERFPEKSQLYLWSSLALLAQRQQGWDQVEALLQRAEQQMGDKVDLRLNRARYLVARYRKDIGDRLRNLAENTAAFSDADRLRLWGSLLSFSQHVDVELAKQLCQRVLREQPSNVRIWYEYLKLAYDSQDTAAMGSILDGIKATEGEGPTWLYGEALRLKLGGKDSQLDQAQQRLAQARELRPSWSRLPLAAAWIYHEQGSRAAKKNNDAQAREYFDRALRNYREAIEGGERTPADIQRAVQLAVQRQDFTTAHQWISVLQGGSAAPLGEVGTQQAVAEVGSWMLEQALQQARKDAAGSEDYRKHIWLGQLLSSKLARATAADDALEAEQLVAEAETALRRAAELAGKTPETWVVLVRFLSQTRQMQEAEQAVQQAARSIPATQASLALGQCYLAMGQAEQAAERFEQARTDFDRAEERFQKALAAAPTNADVVRAASEFFLQSGKSELAEKQLTRIIDGTVKTDQTSVRWARRQLAVISYAGGDYQDRQQALALIEENLEEDPASATDQRLKTRMLQTTQRQEAIQTLENLVAGTGSPAPEDRFRLAVLYRKEGALSKASGQLRSLVASHGNNPNYLAEYINVLLQLNETRNADLYLSQLERLIPPQSLTVDYRADLLVRNGRYDQALDLLTSFVQDPRALPKSKTERLSLVVSGLEKLAARTKQADEEASAKRFATEAKTMCRNFVREALTLLEQTWSQDDPRVLSLVLARLLRNHAATNAEIQRGEKILQAALTRYKRPTNLLRVLGELRSQQERYADAEAVYREILQANEKYWIAMNNLAVLLALQQTKLDESLKLIEAAIDIEGPLSALLDSRATVHMARGRADLALADLKEAVTGNPSAIWCFHQAQAYDLDRQEVAAGAALAKAHELGLSRDTLQPLERKVYDRLKEKLK